MKRFFICLIALFVTLQTLNAQWTEVSPAGSQDYFWDLTPVHADTAFVFSYNFQTLLRTNNGGNSWESFALPIWVDQQEYQLGGMDFPSGRFGYIFGTWLVNGGMYAGGTESTWMAATNDGGESWKTVDLPLPDSGFASPQIVHFFSPDRGVVIQVSGLGYDRILTTEDGGQSWQQQEAVKMSAINGHFKPDGSGTVLAYNINDFLGTQVLFHTTDFGKHWQLIGPVTSVLPIPEQQWEILTNDLFILNAQNGYRIRQTNIDLTHQQFTIERTGNGGLNWSSPELSWQDYHLTGVAYNGSELWVSSSNHIYKRAALDAIFTPLSPEHTMMLSPNPTTTKSVLHITSANAFTGAVDVLFYSANGALEASRKIVLTEGTGVITVPDLSTGVYRLLLTSGQETLDVVSLMIR